MRNQVQRSSVPPHDSGDASTMPYTSVDPDEDFDDAADWLSINAGATSLSNAVKLEVRQGMDAR